MSNKKLNLTGVDFLMPVLFLITTLSCLLIYKFPNAILSDQAAIEYVFAWDKIPPFTDGIASNLVVGLFNLVMHPPAEYLSTYMRIYCLLIYVGSALLLAKTVIKNRFYLIVFVLFLFSSRFPFLWLSRELIYGVFLCLAMTAMLRRWHPLVTSVLIVLLGHAKPELMIVSFVFILMLIWQNRSQLKTIGIIGLVFVGLHSAFFWPEVSQHKIGDLTRRSYLSFEQHYADLVAPHQLTPLENPFINSRKYMHAIFPGTDTMKDVIFQYPKKYYDFIFLSIGHGVKRVIVLFHILLIFIPIIFLAMIHGNYKLDRFGKIYFLSLLGIIPLIMYSYPHIRYFARYYPVAIIFLISFMENVKGTEIEKGWSKGILFLALIVNWAVYIKTLPLMTSGIYWFPD